MFIELTSLPTRSPFMGERHCAPDGATRLLECWSPINISPLCGFFRKRQNRQCPSEIAQG